jgi:urease accessory protein
MMMETHLATGVLRIGLGAIGAGLPSLAFAHAGHADGGFGAGIAHPFSGLDHLVAMVGVGLLAGFAGGRATWLLPVAFLTLAAAGAGARVLGLHGGGWLEPAIATSAAGLVLLLIAARRTPLALLAVASGVCGFVHGLAHGLEAPDGAAALTYVAGVLLATAALHGAGLAAAVLIKSSSQARTREARS